MVQGKTSWGECRTLYETLETLQFSEHGNGSLSISALSAPATSQSARRHRSTSANDLHSVPNPQSHAQNPTNLQLHHVANTAARLVTTLWICFINQFIDLKLSTDQRCRVDNVCNCYTAVSYRWNAIPNAFTQTVLLELESLNIGVDKPRK